MTNKNILAQKFAGATTRLKVQRSIISLFKEWDFKNPKKDIDGFKRYLASHFPELERLVRQTEGNGNGITEILEDYL